MTKKNDNMYTYKFDAIRFSDDLIKCVEEIGWNEFIVQAKTTEKVMLRAMRWRTGTISAQTVAKFCNVMKRSPLLYFQQL